MSELDYHRRQARFASGPIFAFFGEGIPYIGSSCHLERKYRYRILPDTAHTTIAQASLGVLLRLDDRVNRWGASNIPLAEYAARHWVSHAQVGSVSSRVMGTMKTLFDPDKPHFAAWIRIYNIDPWPFWLPRNFAKPLYYSVLCGFYDLVEHLVKKHSQHVNDIGGEHDYPLVAALHGGHFRVAELLFQNGANVGAQGTEGRTPLHRASAWPNNLAVGAVQFLLKHGADVNARRTDLSTPLHLAADRGLFEVAQMLLQRRVDVNSRNVRGKTPLHLVPKPSEAFEACEDNHLNFVQLLLGRGADVNARDECHETPLHLASYFLERKLVRVLLDNGANVNAEDKRGRTSLHQALEARYNTDENDFGVAQLLTERGADVNVRGEEHETPLHLASDFLELNLVRMLVDHGANVNAEDKRGRTPLHRVLEAKGYSDKDIFGVAQLLVERGADVNARDKDHETPLHLASYFPELKLVQMLVDYGASVHAEDKRGRTPLHRVSQSKSYSDKGRLGVAQLLIERGADVNARDEGHGTPLHLASYCPELRFVRMLVDHGADVNAEDKRGRTPLYRVLEDRYYSDEDRSGVAQLLMERGADANTPDNDHETPLHLALRLVSLDLAWILLKYGADPNVENTTGKTPFQLARENIREEMKRPLSEYSTRRAQRAQGVALLRLLYTGTSIRSVPM